MKGNHRFAAGNSLEINRDFARAKQLATGQSPFAAFLGCADSRVPVEIVFDQGFGDLFVNRVAGSVAANEVIASLEFAAQVLKSKVLYVLGHTACGAVTAAMNGTDLPGQFSGLFQYLWPAIKAAKGDIEVAVQENVRNQAIQIAEASPVISKLIQRGEVIVAGGVYNLQTGIVEPVSIDHM